MNDNNDNDNDSWFPVKTFLIKDLSFINKIKVDIFHRFTCPQCSQVLKKGKEIICEDKGYVVAFLCENCKQAYDLVHNRKLRSLDREL